jgi:ANTH domain-containing protein
MIHYDLGHAKVFIGRRSKRHKVKQGGLKHARERLVMMAAEVPLFSYTVDPIPTICAGYGPLIRAYVQFLLAKLRFHRLRPEFHGLFEYEEYVTLKGIDDPNEG